MGTVRSVSGSGRAQDWLVPDVRRERIHPFCLIARINRVHSSRLSQLWKENHIELGAQITGPVQIP